VHAELGNSRQALSDLELYLEHASHMVDTEQIVDQVKILRIQTGI
jgi:regulator of sirC expression with transglutaminase-like and TPR domain